jgi:uncharacterized delta-60 repeat protein
MNMAAKSSPLMKTSSQSRTIISAVILLPLAFLIARAQAVPGDLDLSFDPGPGVASPVSVVAIQPDGKVLIGDPLTFISGMNTYGSARLNADGSLDGTFISHTNFAAYLLPDVIPVITAVQSDGKVLVGGYSHYLLDDYLDVYVFFLNRFNANGSQDDGFDLALGPGTQVSMESIDTLAVQPDGKIIVGGRFSSMRGMNRYGIARLNSNGSLDTNFIAATAFGDAVTALALLPNGKLIIGGFLGDGFLGTNVAVRRLNADGSLDGTLGASALPAISPPSTASLCNPTAG